ncbi:MAG: serine/threonine protein kinase [Deltaproteobacteria bacterium]|nr:serine/threonine protein kinase [Deltaproteobacteria bacterium]
MNTCGTKHRPDEKCPDCGVIAHDGLNGPEGEPDHLSAPTLDLVPGDGPLLDGRYRVGRILARGGMGEVFEGVDVTLRRPVAVKFLGERFVSDAAVVERFGREAEALAALEHAAVVPVYAVGTAADGRPFFVMKRIFGRTIDQLIRAAGPLDVATTVHIAAQVLAGLERIHGAGFVHRDVKPANIMVDEAGRCTLLDFGILRAEESNLTATGFIVGTPEYMAPEQGRDARLASAASDLYSMGATVYAMLTGAPPFRGSSSYEIVNKHHTEVVVAPSTRVRGLSRAVDRVVGRALAKEAGERFASAVEMRRALEALSEPRWSGMPPMRDGHAAATGDTALGGEIFRGAATTIRTRRVRWIGAAALAVAAGLVAVMVGVDFGGARRSGDSTRVAEGAPPRVLAPAVESVRPVEALAPPVVVETTPRPSAVVLPDHSVRRTVAEVRRAMATRRRESHAPSERAAAHAPVARRADTPVPSVRASTAIVRVVVLDRGESTYAEVLVDGAPIGTAPVARHAVTQGTHEFVAKRAGYRAARKVVDVVAGGVRKVTLTLERLDP